MQSLIVLDLVDSEGTPTEVFEGLRLAAEGDYKQRLQEWLKATYSDVFQYVDPAEDSENAIRDAFRTYTPVGQQSRMVSLFIALCETAGLREAKTKSERPASKPTTKPKQRKNKKSEEQPAQRKANFDGGGIPSAVTGLIQSLPKEGGSWSEAKRCLLYTSPSPRD